MVSVLNWGVFVDINLFRLAHYEYSFGNPMYGQVVISILVRMPTGTPQAHIRDVSRELSHFAGHSRITFGGLIVTRSQDFTLRGIRNGDLLVELLDTCAFNSYYRYLLGLGLVWVGVDATVSNAGGLHTYTVAMRYARAAVERASACSAGRPAGDTASELVDDANFDAL